MAKNPRITMTLSEEDQKRLNKVVKALDLSSPGQLVRMLISGDSERIDWIVKELKRLEYPVVMEKLGEPSLRLDGEDVEYK